VTRRRPRTPRCGRDSTCDSAANAHIASCPADDLCSGHVDNTGTTKTFGESSTDEMCFTGMYKYPADGNTFGCTSGPGF